MRGGKIRSFTDLRVWQTGHELVLLIYTITAAFPKTELYGLVDQMRRSASSVTSNIAEGFGREGYKDKIRFYHIAQGSLSELKNQILIARDVGYLQNEDQQKIFEQTNNTHALLQGLLRKSKEFLRKS